MSVMQQQESTSLATGKIHLKRSNALRIKSNNLEALELLPCSLRESLVLLRDQIWHRKQEQIGGPEGQHGSGNQDLGVEISGCDEEEQELSLLEQIKRGVKLKPVNRTRTSGGEVTRQQQEQDTDNTLSEILLRVLRQRYLAIQQTDDESELSSIDSCSYLDCNTKYLDDCTQYLDSSLVNKDKSDDGRGGGGERADDERHNNKVKSCDCDTKTNDCLNRAQMKARRQTAGLLERCSAISMGNKSRLKLTNDLTVRL